MGVGDFWGMVVTELCAGIGLIGTEHLYCSIFSRDNGTAQFIKDEYNLDVKDDNLMKYLSHQPIFQQFGMLASKYAENCCCELKRRRDALLVGACKDDFLLNGGKFCEVYRRHDSSFLIKPSESGRNVILMHKNGEQGIFRLIRYQNGSHTPGRDEILAHAKIINDPNPQGLHADVEGQVFFAYIQEDVSCASCNRWWDDSWMGVNGQLLNLKDIKNAGQDIFCFSTYLRTRAKVMKEGEKVQPKLTHSRAKAKAAKRKGRLTLALHGHYESSLDPSQKWARVEKKTTSKSLDRQKRRLLEMQIAACLSLSHVPGLGLQEVLSETIGRLVQYAHSLHFSEGVSLPNGNVAELLQKYEWTRSADSGFLESDSKCNLLTYVSLMENYSRDLRIKRPRSGEINTDEAFLLRSGADTPLTIFRKNYCIPRHHILLPLESLPGVKHQIDVDRLVRSVIAVSYFRTVFRNIFLHFILKIYTLIPC